MEIFKDAMDALNQRIRSPFLGSIVIVFAALNWKPLWFLLFADVPVAAKFAFFEGNTTAASLYWWPIALGVAVALVLPWLKLLGAWVAMAPVRRLRNMQFDEAQGQRVYELGQKIKEVEAKATLDAATEHAIIDAAERLQKAKDVGGDAEEQITEARDVDDEVLELPNLMALPFAINLLVTASKIPSGTFKLSNHSVTYFDAGGTRRKAEIGSNHADGLIMEETLIALVKAGLFSHSGNEFEVTLDGYNALEKNKKEIP